MIVTRIWRLQPGKYFFLSTKSATGKWRDIPFKRSEFKNVPKFIRNNQDKDIYFCPHGFSKPRRVKEYSVLPSLMWSDLDEADPRKISLRPTVAFESSPGRYVGLWLTDKPITESLNRRLSYEMGDADKSGWDLTQVLRFPGTTNYKYESQPRTKILWANGHSYKISDIEKQLPDDDEDDNDGDGEAETASSIFRRYERQIPSWCRRELISGRPHPGKRSDMIWKLENTLLEAGLSSEESFVLIKSSPWNKFKGRSNEDKQLRRELEKAVGQHLKGKKKGKVNGEKAPYKFLSESLDQVQRENIDWIWYPYLARGELSILEGDPGLGKSYLAQMVSGYICDGKQLPSIRRDPTVTGKVAYFDIENSRGSVTKPRMVNNKFKHLENFFQDEQPFSIDDVERLDEVYEAIERLSPTLVVFDTLNTYIGRADTYKSSEATQAFATFRDISKRFNCSVLVLRHLTKGSKERALYRGQGSIAFSGLARTVMTVGVDPEDNDIRVMALTKYNTTKKPPALTFRIDELPDRGKDQDRSRFDWGDFVELSSEDILSAPTKDKGKEKEAAIDFLKEILDDGPVDFQKIQRMAEARAMSRRMIYRAADAIGVVRDSVGFGKDKKSTWELPAGK